MKKRVLAVLFVFCIMSMMLTGCSSKTRFSDLDAVMAKDTIIKAFGSNYEITTAQDRMVYRNLRLIEALPGGLETKLQFFLDGENTYAFAYYIYDDAENNFEKVKAEFDRTYGESVPGEQENTLLWKKGEREVSLSKNADYIVAGMY